jgi:23S rRNA (uracil1939-C5)-methyltransferase
MEMKRPLIITATFDKIVGGGQSLGHLDDGKKIFAWGALPGETARIEVTKKKSHFLEGVIAELLTPSAARIAPADPDSYLSTSPWQIMPLATEQHYKAALIEEAFELHDIVLPRPIDVFTDGRELGYRNKVEFSFWWDNETQQLDLAFFRRGTHGKIPVEGTSLAHPAIDAAARRIRDMLRQRNVEAYALKTLIVRCDQAGSIVAQLYVKDEDFAPFDPRDLQQLQLAGFELIFSNPKSPASVITRRLQAWGSVTLVDTVLDIPFAYAAEGFFQINLPVYEQALKDMREWVEAGKPTLDLYSGVGTIGLTIGGSDLTLIESNEHAVREMKRNIAALGRDASAKAVLAPSETALEHVTAEACVIVDPPRAGLHEDVIDKLLDVAPARIIYLSCNPATQARDVARLAETYGIRAHQGYNFFPRTPHIEHLVVLDKKVAP